MRRVCQITGKIIEGEEALRQAIQRTLGTRKGSMLLNRSFGSELPDLLDKNIDEVLIFLTSTILDDLSSVKEFKCDEVEVISTKNEIANGQINVLITGQIGEERINAQLRI